VTASRAVVWIFFALLCLCLWKLLFNYGI